MAVKAGNEELIKKLGRYKGIKPRLTFLFPLSEVRRRAIGVFAGKSKPTADLALKLLKSADKFEKIAGLHLLPQTSLGTEEALPHLKALAEDKLPGVRKAAADAMAQYGERALPYLTKLAEDDDPDVREAATSAKVKIIQQLYGEEAFPYLTKLAKDNDPYVKKATAEALAQYGERALPYLTKLAKDNDPYVREAATSAKVKIIQQLYGEEAFPYLTKLAKDNDPYVKKATAEALAQYGEEAFPYLTKLAKDNDPYVKKATAEALAQYGERALPYLTKLAKDNDPYVREAATSAIFAIGGYKRLLWNQKPLFATPFTDELAKRIERLQEISSILQKEFKDDFIGITVFGSTAKGYMLPTSDLDYAVIANDKKVLERFRELAKDLNLCQEHYVTPSEKNGLDPLFYGIFFGDHKKLAEIQYRAVKGMSEEEWEKVREKIYLNETNLSKAFSRFGIGEENLKHAASLLRVPPTREKVLEILEKRIKNN